METEDIEKRRRGTDIVMAVTIGDSLGNKIDWFSFSELSAYMYSEDQRIGAGACEIGEIKDDGYTLMVKYDAGVHYEYDGVNTLVLSFMYGDSYITMNKPAVEIFPFSDSRISKERGVIQLSLVFDR